ncbi:transglycosylase SLT domain-containing protein [Streptomyces zingiberis]|uniref:Transglycosylase SLT domain-containing protein n=1 Tax=Streptomyces zingiberis TaxID=2053010 RepID=A0ABX1BWQ1_9ACTN|nr:transglycosylase SLT domain-containing protein [Streptomyces zingiberis]NJQ02076.1 transglycosylase SLT domain-containing protein [Streptomyces zingiberis]
MRVPTFSATSTLLGKPHKISAAGLAAVSLASVAFAAAPAPASGADKAAAARSLPAAYSAPATAGQDGKQSDALYSTVKAPGTSGGTVDLLKAVGPTTGKDQPAKAPAAGTAKAKADASRAGEQAANRSTDRPAPKAEAPKADAKAATPAPKTYPNNLDGWIREAMSIMKKNGIPGSYEGIHRNIMRESSGNPNAINNWDINAKNGIPSKGLLQVIQPTFDAYHVAGTKKDLYDPVANIVAACNYAADKYGSMDNVDSAY